jgi:hypothetical protein
MVEQFPLEFPEQLLCARAAVWDRNALSCNNPTPEVSRPSRLF